MSEINPYASPQSDLEDMTIETGVEDAGVWRMNDLLVVRKGATLPLRCLKSNEPAIGTSKKRFIWQPPLLRWVLVLLVTVGYVLPTIVYNYLGLGPPITLPFYPVLLAVALVQLLVQQKITLQLPLSAVWLKRRRDALIATAIVCVGVLLVAFSGFLPSYFGYFLLIVICTAGILRWCFRDADILTAARISSRYAYFKGVHPEYLDALPN